MLALFVGTCVTSLACIAFTRDIGRVAAVWPVNALVVAAMLRSPRQAWPWLLAAGVLGIIAGDLMSGDAALDAVVLSACNILEIYLCAWFMDRRSKRRTDLSEGANLLSFLFVCALTPLASAAGASAFLYAAHGAPVPETFSRWYFADALGLLTVTPALLALTSATPRRVIDRLRTWTGWLPVLGLAICIAVVFAQSSYPLLFLIPPALILVAFELELAGAAVALLATCFVAIVATRTGHGPATLIQGGLTERLAILQLFLATLTLSVLPVAVALMTQRRLRERLVEARDLAESSETRVAALLTRSRLAEQIAGIGHWRLELATGHRTWSDLTFAIHGLPLDAPVERINAAIDLFAPEHQPLIREVVRDVASTGRPFDLEVCLHRADTGERRAVVFKGEAERGPDGKVSAVFGVMWDITEQKAKAATVAESEARFRLLADSAKDVLLQVDARDVVTYVSPSVRRFGYRPEDVIGRLGASFIHPDDVAVVLERVRSQKQGEPVDWSADRSYRLRKADGDYAWIEANASTVYGEDGEIVAVISQIRDVSERREATVALAASEARYRLLTDNATDVITCYSLDGDFTFLSPSVAQVMGYEPAELIGRKTTDFMVAEDVKPTLRRFADYIASGAKEPMRFDYRAVRKDGAVAWFEAQVKAIHDDTGRLVAFQDVVRDITQRKAMESALQASELRYRVIARNATDMVSRTRLDGVVLELSSSVADIAGYAPEEIVGRNWTAFLHPDDVEPTLAVYRDLITGARTNSQPIGYRARHKDGRWIWLEGNPTPVREDDGRIVEFIDVTRDVSARMQLQADLQAARDAAEAAASAKSDFLANVSHEIRTPLTAVLGFTSLLTVNSSLDETARQQVGRISAAGQALLTLVNDVLDFSKLEAGQFEITPAATEIEGTLTDGLLMFGPQAEAKGLSLEVDLQALPAWLSLDRGRIQQVIHNLVGNAIKFTASGSVTLRARHDGHDGRLRVEVVDTGAGLTSGQQAKLFQRFSQVDASSTRRHGGTGLGLAICKGLIEAMGGEIGVTSQLGLGSTFWFDIPAPVVDAAQVEQASELPSLMGIRVLVADDNPTNRELVRIVLEALQAEVTDVADGEAALELAMKTPFDVLLLDVRMPGISGQDVAVRLRQAGGPNDTVPILAFTAESPDLVLGGGSPFDGLVRKPLAPAELAATLAEHLFAPAVLPAPAGRPDAGHA